MGKLIAILSLLMHVFTNEYQRYNMEDVCNHRFFAEAWSHI